MYPGILPRNPQLPLQRLSPLPRSHTLLFPVESSIMIMRLISLAILPLIALALSSLNHGYIVSTNEATTDISLAITGIASQTANFITVLNSASTSMMSVTPAGVLTAVTVSDGTFTSTAGVITGVVDLTVNSILVGSSGTAISSDRRLKENIRNVTDALVLLDRLRGVRFDWLPSAPGADQRVSPADLGFIAQEVEDVFPELVRTSAATGIKAVLYTGVIPVLVEAAKAQQVEIRDLSATVGNLAATTADMATKLAAAEEHNHDLAAKLAALEAKFDAIMSE